MCIYILTLTQALSPVNFTKTLRWIKLHTYTYIPRTLHIYTFTNSQYCQAYMYSPVSKTNNYRHAGINKVYFQKSNIRICITKGEHTHRHGLKIPTIILYKLKMKINIHMRIWTLPQTYNKHTQKHVFQIRHADKHTLKNVFFKCTMRIHTDTEIHMRTQRHRHTHS